MMMRRAGPSCSGKDAKVFILYAGCAVPSYSKMSKTASYAAKELVLCWLPHVSTNVEVDLGGPFPCCDSGGRGGREGDFSVYTIVCPWVGWTGGSGMRSGTSGGGMWPVLTCSHVIALYSPDGVVGMCGTVGCFGAGGAGGS